MTARYDRMTAILTAQFMPLRLEIRDDSAKHAGHAARNGLTPNAETHFTITLVSPAFKGLSRIARTRAVNAALAGELETGLHALALTLRTPEEIEG